MKILQVVSVIYLFAAVSSERFSAIEELLSLSDNEDQLAVEVTSLIENLESLVAKLKR